MQCIARERTETKKQNYRQGTHCWIGKKKVRVQVWNRFFLLLCKFASEVTVDV